MSLAAAVFCLITLFLIYIYHLSVRKFCYWKKKNVQHLKPWPVLGNYGEYVLMRKYLGEVSQQLCRQFPDEPYFGSYYGTEPALVILDPEIIKLVFTKDFYYFNSREIGEYTHKEVATQNLFFTQGDKWKVVRQNLTPIFTSAKMRNMFYLIANCGHAMEMMLDEEISISEDVEAKSLMIRYTMDCIGTCAFGIETDTMSKNKDNNPFVMINRKIFATSTFMGFKRVFRAIWPNIFYGLGLKFFPVEMNTFFKKILMSVLQKRKFKPTGRQDFVDQILAWRQSSYIAGDCLSPKNIDNKQIQMQVTDELLISQCIIFFGAGFETSASTLAYTLYELAKDQESQRRVQEEVDAFLHRHSNELVYDCVTELPFVEACLNETMRLYPVLPVITREVVEDYTFPTGLKAEKGMRVHLPVYHIHRDPNNFPEPDTFRPERFYQEARDHVKPYTFFPFGEGPRQCIGLRFAKMQTIVGLITILKKYSLDLSEGTPTKLEFIPSSFLTNTKNAINLKLTIRDEWKERAYSQ